jgi:hypothetical protein
MKMYKSKYSHARSADLLSHWKSESKITFKIFEPAPATIMSQQLVNGKKRQSQSQLTSFFKPPPGGLMRDSLSSFKQPIRYHCS